MNRLVVIFPTGQLTNPNLMAFNLATFKTRALTAIVFALAMLIGLLSNGWSFIILFTVIHFGCWYEFAKLVKKIKGRRYRYFLPIGLIYITLPIAMMLDTGFQGNIFTHKNGSKDVLHYVYILPCAIVFSIWINDTMAYIIGSFIGRTPLSTISPKKTWEGTVGGAIVCITVIAAIGWWSKLFSVKHLVIIAAICAVFGTFGDLLESKLKRTANVKDSGSLMPGHGGFLDRFDSLLIATPFVWLYYFFIQ
jgi:phosphatidate cytidylyltransferase